MIRKARKEDAREIAPLLYIIWEDMELPILKNATKEKLLEVLEKAIQTEDYRYSYNHIYVYEVDGFVAGLISGYKGELEDIVDKPWEFIAMESNLGTDIPVYIDKEAEPYEFYVDMLVVDENYRGKGIGSKLLSYIPVILKENNQSIAGLNCDRSNNGARKLYESFGFKSSVEKKLSGHLYDYMRLTIEK